MENAFSTKLLSSTITLDFNAMSRGTCIVVYPPLEGS